MKGENGEMEGGEQKGSWPMKLALWLSNSKPFRKQVGARGKDLNMVKS